MYAKRDGRIIEKALKNLRSKALKKMSKSKILIFFCAQLLISLRFNNMLQ